MPTSPRTLPLAVWLLVVAALPIGPARATASALPALQSDPFAEPTSVWEARLAQVLAEQRSAEPAPAAARVRALVALGPPAAAALLEATVTGRVASSWPAPERDLALSADELELVRTAARALGREALQDLWSRPREGAETPDTAARLRGLEAVALAGRAGDLEAGVELALLPDPGAPGAMSLQRGLERAVREVVHRDPAATATLRALLEASDDLAAVAVVRGISAGQSVAALQALVAELDRHPELEPLLLSAAGHAARGTPRPIDEWTRVRIRQRLTREEPLVARAAAETVRAMDDPDAVPLLIDCLERGDPHLADVALRALRELSGIRHGPEPLAWSAWLESERLWSERRLPTLVRSIDAGGPGDAIAALREIGVHRWRRHELAALIAPALDDPSAAVRTSACAALASLGSLACAQQLVARLEDEDQRVAEAAWACLTSLSGHELPRERAAWTRALSLPD